MSSQRKVNVGILGATGTVGQRFVLLLANHPFFVLHALGASSRSAGQEYVAIAKWKQTRPIPENVKHMKILPCEAEKFSECAVVFSGLDHDVAGPIEEQFRASEIAVFSNAKNFRRDPLVPLIVPLVNSDHLAVLGAQKQSLCPPTSKGFIVANANCSTTGLVVPLAALERAFGPIESVVCTTLQAVSGGGYPGVSSMDILDNVVPFIGGEEEKIEWETSKILGGILPQENGFDYHEHAPLNISASCNRVPVMDGHTVCASVRFKNRDIPTISQVKSAFQNFRCEAQDLNCPNAPEQVIFVHEEVDRPQPRLDRDFQNGSGINIGRIRSCNVFDIKFVALVNNVQAGAAQGATLNAEIAYMKQLI